MPEDRRLAAIMFTDIVGYTKLMGSDEDKAFEVLKKNHAIHENLINKYNGTLIKEIGDGTLASFPLASDAVRCAMEIQRAAKNQNIPLKIGIHQGEMVMAGADVLGDGVNIASRLQEASHEGCITISGKVYSDIHNKAGINTKYIGEKKLKNLDDPIKMYEVLCEKGEQKPEKDMPFKSMVRILYYLLVGIVTILVAVILWQILPSKEIEPSLEETELIEMDKSIAVLPFRDDSQEKDNQYFCDGMMEEILTHLQKIADLRVKSVVSVEQYRNTVKTIETIAEELNVSFLLTGSVRKYGNNLRITTQLIEASTGDHLWAEPFDGAYTDTIFVLQSNIAKKIASSLKAVITPDEERRISKNANTDIEAYEYILRAKDLAKKYWDTHDGDYVRPLHSLADQALKIDPNSPMANVMKGVAYQIESLVAERNSKTPMWDSVSYYADIALRLDPELESAYMLKGDIYSRQGKNDKAKEYFSTALDLSPNNQNTLMVFGRFLTSTGKKNDLLKGMAYRRKAIELSNEYDPQTAYQKYGYYNVLGEYSNAEMYLLKSIDLGYTHPSYHVYSAFLINHGRPRDAIRFLDSVNVGGYDRSCLTRRVRSYIELNEFAQAEHFYEKVLNEGHTIQIWDSIPLGYLYLKTKREAQAKSMLNTIRIQAENRLSESKSFLDLYYLCMIHAILEDTKEAMRYLLEMEKSSIRFYNLEYIESSTLFSNIQNEPEFESIMKRYRAKNATIRAQIKEMEEQEGFNL